MSFGIYIVGFLILIGGLIYAAVILHMAAQWIAVGAIVLLGLAILTGVKAVVIRDRRRGWTRRGSGFPITRPERRRAGPSMRREGLDRDGERRVSRASRQFFDDHGSVYVGLCASGQSLEGDRRGGSVVLYGDYVTRY
jgi:hypothetical protein